MASGLAISHVSSNLCSERDVVLFLLDKEVIRGVCPFVPYWSFLLITGKLKNVIFPKEQILHDLIVVLVYAQKKKKIRNNKATTSSWLNQLYNQAMKKQLDPSIDLKLRYSFTYRSQVSHLKKEKSKQNNPANIFG